KLRVLDLNRLGTLTSLDFLAGSNIRYLALENAKNLHSWEGLRFCQQLKFLTAGDGAFPVHKILLPLLYCKQLKEIWLGKGYSQSEIQVFLKKYKGNILWIRGKYYKGEESDRGNWCTVFERAELNGESRKKRH